MRRGQRLAGARATQHHGFALMISPAIPVFPRGFATLVANAALPMAGL